jgi:hypothetical protein
MDPVRELHTGQRRVKGRTNRPDTRKHLNLRTNPRKTSCIRRGVHTRTYPPGRRSAPRSGRPDRPQRVESGHSGRVPSLGESDDILLISVAQNELWADHDPNISSILFDKSEIISAVNGPFSYTPGPTISIVRSIDSASVRRHFVNSKIPGDTYTFRPSCNMQQTRPSILSYKMLCPSASSPRNMKLSARGSGRSNQI